MKKFEFEYVQRDVAIIYAKTESDAIEQFEDEYTYDDYDITELKK